MAPKNVAGPDQPRSWAIALAACVINTLLSGISRATGLLYVALIESYGVSRLQANLPFTIRNVVRNLAGPLVGAIGQRYGPRDVTIVGGVLSSLGIILCYFAPNVIWITVLWGGMHGFGVALGNTLFQVIVTQYFLKYRATASGLAMSGACIGAFTLPIILEYMLANFGLAGTFLLTGGLIMHVLPAAIMLVEPPWIREKTVQEKVLPLNNMPRRVSKLPQTMTIIQEGKPVVSEVRSSGSFEKNGNIVHSSSRNRLSVNGIDNPTYSGSKLDLSEKTPDEPEEEGPYMGRLRTISFGEISISVPVNNELQESSITKGTLKVLKDPMFHMISLSLGAVAMVFDPSITVIVDYITDKGLKEDVAKYFISMMAIGDLFGRMGFGWVTDKNYLSVPKFMLILQVGLGICQMLLAVFNTFDTLMVIVVLHGLLSGATLIMFPILVGKYLQSVQSLAIGFISFFSGLLAFTVPPIIGYFRDYVGSYDGLFYITGGFSVCVGFLWIFEPLLLRLGTRIRKENSASAIVSP
ncbi:hypothetical protein JTE90_022267 [Oedothorax gibbosus]|uniref:Major facilitator superfamily (MFS) profile domain-containing protein n=1 Tax=Oedothorax gibbosus TaxID=931172 RepID=A0AAV6VX21_9ARAC|nr:hypothetical protein JTE90_022267 [Oedothorax gibbosus]